MGLISKNVKGILSAVVTLVVIAIAAYAILNEGSDRDTSPSITAASTQEEKQRQWAGDLKKMECEVRKGDSIFTILKACGIDARGIHLLSQAASHLYDLTNILPGQVLTVWITGESPAKLARLVYNINPLKYLEVIPQEDSFKALIETRINSVTIERIQGKIKSSLYESAMQAGLDPEIAMKLVEIFGWDINFAPDIQEGDSFTVLYESRRIEGKQAGNGRVLAARFALQDREHTAIYHDGANGHRGYYDEHGNPVRKLFLKAPLNYRRISSGFSRNRIHPIFHDMRPHLGVDYAAPKGTPVVVIGKGRIARCGWIGGFGKTVTVEHPGGYRSHYGHLSGFAKGVARGKAVEQGDVIGYVGSTGIATGPHLDFRVEYRGSYVNPLRLSPVTMPRLFGEALEEFKKASLERLTLLNDSRQG